MSEEDLQHELVRWMEMKKRLTFKEVWAYVNSSLFSKRNRESAQTPVDVSSDASRLHVHGPLVDESVEVQVRACHDTLLH